QNRPGEDVSDSVNEPEKIIDRDVAAHPAEADERRRSQGGPDQDQLSRAETVHQQRADPEREQGSEGKAQRDLVARPSESALSGRFLVIIVEKRHVVVRNPNRDSERANRRDRHPPAVKWLRLHGKLLIA